MDTLPLITASNPELVLCPCAAAKGVQKHSLPCVQQHTPFRRGPRMVCTGLSH